MRRVSVFNLDDEDDVYHVIKTEAGVTIERHTHTVDGSYGPLESFDFKPEVWAKVKADIDQLMRRAK